MWDTFQNVPTGLNVICTIFPVLPFSVPTPNSAFCNPYFMSISAFCNPRFMSISAFCNPRFMSISAF